MKNTTKDLILLNSIPNFGYKKLQVLLGKFGNTTNIVNSIKPKKAFNIEEEIELINKQNIHIVTIFDKKYPDNLKQIHSPPIVLYVKGRIEDTGGNTVAVVGSRDCTYYGKNMTGRICSSLAKLNITVVSGMARGIDTVAHKEALTAGGKTVAIL